MGGAVGGREKPALLGGFPLGPLTGIRVVEIAGIGPCPWCAMVLSDMGAEVIRVDRADAVGSRAADDRPLEFVNLRGRRSLAVDLKQPDGVEVVLRLASRADALIEGFRPGVVERLGIGPGPCLERNGKLVYGRMTGWGQNGPRSQAPGHDINYLAQTGLLDAIGPPGGGPVPPLNLIADYGGGGMALAFGVVCGILEARGSGEGQVIDAAMVDGAGLLGSLFFGMRQIGRWRNRRGTNMIDGGAPYYGTYETADGRWIAVGAIEPKFYGVLVEAIGLSIDELPDMDEVGEWPQVRRRFAEVFKSRTRDEWTEVLLPLEACYSPVLSLDEALEDEQNLAREAFVSEDGVLQPAPAPRFSRTPGEISGPAASPGEHTDEVLQDWGFEAGELQSLRAGGAIVQR